VADTAVPSTESVTESSGKVTFVNDQEVVLLEVAEIDIDVDALCDFTIQKKATNASSNNVDFMLLLQCSNLAT